MFNRLKKKIKLKRTRRKLLKLGMNDAEIDATIQQLYKSGKNDAEINEKLLNRVSLLKKYKSRIIRKSRTLNFIKIRAIFVGIFIISILLCGFFYFMGSEYFFSSESTRFIAIIFLIGGFIATFLEGITDDNLYIFYNGILVGLIFCIFIFPIILIG